MHILVDLDGTLLDTRPGIIASIRFALDRLGAPVPAADELGWVIGPPLRATFPRLLPDSGLLEEAIALYRRSYRDGAMYQAAVYAGVPEALERMAEAGCRLIVATAKPHVFARPLLERFHLGHRFAAVYGPELDGTNDHKTDLLAHILEREGLAPRWAVMVGDRDLDVRAAAANGIRAVGVTWGYGSVGELSGAGAAALCETPDRLAATALALLAR